jgi:hypothetical protein
MQRWPLVHLAPIDVSNIRCIDYDTVVIFRIRRLYILINNSEIIKSYDFLLIFFLLELGCVPFLFFFFFLPLK